MNNDELAPEIEKEIKFVFPSSEVGAIRASLSVLPNLLSKGEKYEKTSILDSNDGRLFGEDARLRIREIGIGRKEPSDEVEICYKRRLGTTNGIKSEEEVEIHYRGKAAQAFLLFGKLGYALVESYERYRETYLVDGAKLTVDRFPFATVLEIEGEVSTIYRLCGQLGLEASNSYPRSCDDIYHELCVRRGLLPKRHISFDDPDMPALDFPYGPLEGSGR